MRNGWNSAKRGRSHGTLGRVSEKPFLVGVPSDRSRRGDCEAPLQRREKMRDAESLKVNGESV